MSTSSRSVLIVGSGALATLFAARLAAAGNAVTLLGAWPQALAALNTHGAQLATENGARAWPVRAVNDPQQCRGIRQALVLVKAWQTPRAAQQLAQCLPADGIALTLQNGWGNYDHLCDALGAPRAAAGITTLGATLLEPGLARAGGDGPITLGEHPALAPLAERLAEAGFTVRTSDNISGLLWGKLTINAAINPITALLRIANGKLLDEPLRTLTSAAAEEAAAVGRALGLHLPYADAAAAALDVAARTAANHSSMYQDAANGRPTEIDAISGAIVRQAQRLGIAAPINTTLWALVDGSSQPGLEKVL